ncbi:hypothetical protein MKZ38_010802 [Zalerion maritima]|uniref:Uncharacterized protein n=1 Tax=Zalerion maritima TaxID=339359 RepID=A0AAD5WVT8_9PEZI|nr:hypothetical protein MKZ38_010802 [Zalerion maritima]
MGYHPQPVAQSQDGGAPGGGYSRASNQTSIGNSFPGPAPMDLGNTGMSLDNCGPDAGTSYDQQTGSLDPMLSTGTDSNWILPAPSQDFALPSEPTQPAQPQDPASTQETHVEVFNNLFEGDDDIDLRGLMSDEDFQSYMAQLGNGQPMAMLSEPPAPPATGPSDDSRPGISPAPASHSSASSAQSTAPAVRRDHGGIQHGTAPPALTQPPIHAEAPLPSPAPEQPAGGDLEGDGEDLVGLDPNLQS